MTVKKSILFTWWLIGPSASGKSSIAKKLYNNNSKPLTARYFSEKICKTPNKIDRKIDSLIEKIKDLEWIESIIERI